MSSSKIRIIRRDDLSITVTFTNSDGDAIDITGYTIFFTVKRRDHDTDDDAVISKTVSSHTTPASGISAISLSKTDTNVSPGLYVYDLQLKDGSGNITSTERGTLEIIQDITQRTT